MKFPQLSTKNKFTIAAAIAVVLILVIATIFFHNIGNRNQLPVAALQPSNQTSSTAPTQKTVDTGLSLFNPAATAPQTTQIPPEKTTPSTYAGCKLNLAFGTTGNDSYKLIAQNLGSIACQSTSISIYYADGESFASATPSPTADGYYWQFGTLAPGKEKDIALTTTKNASATNASEACLSSSNGADSCANASTNAPTATTSGAITQTTNTQLSPPPGGELGVWVWTPLSQMPETDMQNIVNEAAANHFNAIYITVDEYLDIAEATSTAAVRQAQLQSYNKAVGDFLQLAAAKNIAVDAEAGARDWGQPGDQSEAERIMAFVASYNQAHANTPKFRGVQYDIEPYLLPQYANGDATAQATVLTQYVELIVQLAVQAKSDDLPLSIVVPHFYDAVIAWTPAITIDGITDYTYNQIARILNQVPDARIIVMAYRNFAAGADGAISLAQTEVNVADTGNVQVIVAQETGPVQPSYVTFYDESKNDLATQAAQIEQAFANNKSFKGIAIDYLDPFLELN